MAGRSPSIAASGNRSAFAGGLHREPAKRLATDQPPPRQSALEDGIASRAGYRIHLEKKQEEHGVEQAGPDVGVGAA